MKHRPGPATGSNATVAMVVMLALAGAGCGGGDPAGPQTCGAMTCSERQSCDTSSAPARCVCKENFTGTDCSSCARGFMLVAGKCQPADIDCRLGASVCGARGTCFEGTGLVADSCVCQPGYGGRVCQVCADGYQDNDRNGTCTAACGATTCPGMMTCTDATGTARCACPGNRTGANCDQCPAGWLLRDGQCVQTCAATGVSCGSKKMCDTVQGICVCRPEYTGDLCDTCAPGFQDNDRNGVCTASCAATTCPMGQMCSDTTGTARCACPADRTGTNCEMCLAGWVMRPSDNTCVQTCAATSCGARKYCDETQSTPTCVCQAGYAGADCSACAAGYIPDGAGMCVRGAPAGTTLLGAGRTTNGEYLLAINPAGATPTVTPLRPLANLSNLRLATDVASKSIFSASSSAISRIDATTGRLTPVATVQTTMNLCFGGGALYTFGQLSPYLLKRIDPATGGVADIGPSNLASGAGSSGLAWEAGGTLLYARPPATAMNGAEFFRVNATTAAVTSLGALSDDGTGRLRPGDNRVGMAFDTTGKLFVATRLGRAPGEIVAEHCRKMAAGLGYTGYEAAPITSVEINYNGIGAGATRILNSRNPQGKEIVAYASYGRRTSAKAMLRVETANPDAFVCVSSYEEVLELVISPATARFTAIALTGYRPILTLVVEGSVPPVTRPTLHVHSPTGSVATAFNGAAGGYQFSKMYSTTEWSTLRLPTHVVAWDADPSAPSVLLEIDVDTRTIKRVLSFTGIDLYPTLAPWAP
jgi:hypothetical protein